jgi:hypothetical protein
MKFYVAIGFLLIGGCSATTKVPTSFPSAVPTTFLRPEPNIHEEPTVHLSNDEWIALNSHLNYRQEGGGKNSRASSSSERCRTETSNSQASSPTGG